MRHRNRGDDPPDDEAEADLASDDGFDGDADGGGTWGLTTFDVAILVVALVGLAVVVAIAYARRP